MAESVLYGLATTILSQLSSLALDELQLLWGHKDHLDKLEGTVTTIRNVLEDAERRQCEDAAVQGWLGRLKDALYKADDLFDSISAKILHQKANSNTLHKLVSKPYNLAFVVRTTHEVKAIRQRLDDISRDISQFNFLPNRVSPDRADLIERERTHSYIPSNEVIGRDQEQSDLVKRLLLPTTCMEQGGVSVVGVIGIGGLGKTTLAQLVYNDQRVQQGFDLCMWACVNYFKSLDKVLAELVKSIDKTDPRDLTLDQLQSCFRQKIEGKRFLLVLDDVLEEDPQNWCKLRVLLDDGKEGSMVLATTRSTNVAQCLRAVEPYYYLKVISDHNAWLLFKKMAFDEGKEPLSHELEELGQQIVKKCANVPISIVTIANLLRYREKKKWFPLVYDELSKVVPSEYDKIMQVLKISYNELAYPVKCCFAYCSLFPKGYEFEKDKLVRLWIAQGFVDPRYASQSLEDRAEEYFSCLVERCFFQDMRMSRIKGVKRYTWRMNNLVLDLAKEVAKLEYLLVDEVAHSSWGKTPRHISFNCEPQSLVSHVEHLKSLRSFLCLSKTSTNPETVSKLVMRFKAVRALDLSQLEIKEIPASIGELIHLRFLDLSKNAMGRLPSSICNLHHLQSFILQGCDNLIELPENIGKLVSLRELVIEDCNKLSHLPAGLTALTSLVILKIDSCAGRCAELPPLSHLPSLKELYIHNMSSMVAIEDSKHYKPDIFFPSLETLWIWNIPNLTSWWLQGPTELPVFSRVTKLNIRNCQRLVTSSMPMFPLVEHLKFESVQNHLIWHGIRNNVVKRLRVSRIRGLRSIAESQTRNLTHLQKLSVYRCEQLETVSCKGLAHLTSLQKLKITACEKLKWIDLDDHEKPEFPWANMPRIKYLEIPVKNMSIHKGFKHMSCLEVLKMYTCDQSLDLLDEVRHLTSLQQLTLTNCEEVHLSWKVLLSLNRLQILTFSGIQKVFNIDPSVVTILNSSIQDLKIYGGSAEWIDEIPWKSLESLQYLHFSGIANLKELPEGMKWLTGLQRLKIMVCESVVSLPRFIRNLTSLRYLEIRGSSPELKKRCEESKGEDWPYIQHIQERIIT